MSLTHPEVSYFIQQVMLSGKSLGVDSADLVLLGVALMSIFDYRCSPPTTVVAVQGAQLQSICSDSTCPLAMNSTCALYEHGLNGNMGTSVVSTRATTVVKGTPAVTAAGTAGMINLDGTARVNFGTGIASANGQTTVTGVVPGPGGVNSTLIAVVGGTATVSSGLPRVTAFNGTVVVSGFLDSTAASPLASGTILPTGSGGTVVGVFPNGTTIISNGAPNGASGSSSIIPSNDTASIGGAANNSDSTPVPGTPGSASAPAFGPFANGTAGQGGVVNGTGVAGGVGGGIVGTGGGSGSGSGSGSGTGTGSGSGNGGVPPQASDGVALKFSMFVIGAGVGFAVVGLFL
ncbi:hypothetical protein CJF31_00004316 [Rutstroemia sp. NJR-2017a BVV2]|nr:hypothetical protein CJF31_00004316 [Rutstroemia sp. NJR-2017a BVV2]